MNKYISFAFVALALIASVSCDKYYNNHGQFDHGNLANLALSPYGNSGSSPSADYVPASVYSAPHGYEATAPAHSSHSSYKNAKYSVQPVYATELYPGQQKYHTYNYPAIYSKDVLPLIPSYPVAKLIVPREQSYGGSPAASYGAY